MITEGTTILVRARVERKRGQLVAVFDPSPEWEFIEDLDVVEVEREDGPVLDMEREEWRRTVG